MVFWLCLAAVIVILGALTWWSSGRTTARAPHPDPAAERDRGRAIEQAIIHREGQHGTGLF